ncbi:MAG: ribosome silencing factor [Clostridiales bacterium]|jgi:ribosome-associated protein|nr:ribosome silencing factor [Clostridiales bacterium]
MDSVDIMDAVKAAYNAASDKMGDDIIVLDIRGISVLTEFFVIASANNSNQLKAMADHIQEKLHVLGVRMRHAEGVQSARWILLDFGDIVVQLFRKEEREYYRLEKLWGDAKTILPDELA